MSDSIKKIIEFETNVADFQSQIENIKQLINDVVNEDTTSKTFSELEKQAHEIEAVLSILKQHGMDSTVEFSKLESKMGEIVNQAKLIDDTVGRLTDTTFADLHNSVGDVKSEMQLLQESIQDVLNNDSKSQTFEQLIGQQKVLNDLLKHMKKEGLDNSKVYGDVQAKFEEIRSTAKRIGDSVGWATGDTFNSLSEKMGNVMNGTHQVADGMSIMSQQADTTSGSMGKLYNSIDFLDRTTTLPISGALGEVTGLFGFATQAMSEFNSANNAAERASEQANKAQEALNKAIEAGQSTTELATRAQEASTIATEAATNKAKQFRLAMLSIGLGIFVLLLGQIFENWEKISKAIGLTNTKMAEHKKIRVELNSAVKEGAASAASELSKIKLLYNAATDLLKPMKERIKAANNLISLHKETFKGLNAEAVAAGKAATAYDKLAKKIVAYSIVEGAKKKMTELIAEQLEELGDAQEKFDKAYAQSQKDRSKKYADEIVAANVNTNNIANLARGANDIGKIERSIENITKKFQGLIDKYSKVAGDFTGLDEAPKAGGKPTKDTSKADELKRQKEEALKIAKDAAASNEMIWFNDQDKELIILKRGYEEKKALLVKAGVDTSSITEQYEMDRTAITEKYAKIRDDNEQKRLEEQLRLQKEYDEKLLRIKTDQANLNLDNLESDFSLSSDELSFQRQLEFIDLIQAAKLEALDAAFNEEKMRLGENQSEIEQLTKDHEARKRQIEAESAKDKKAIRKAEVQSAVAGAEMMGQAFDQLSGTMEEGTLGQKALGIASSTISMFTAIVKTWEGYASMGPFGVAGAIAQSAAIAASGIINIKKIAAVKINGKSGNSTLPSMSFDTANFSAPQIDAQQATGNGDVRITNPDDIVVKTYILDSDLDDAERRKQMMDDLSGF